MKKEYMGRKIIKKIFNLGCFLLLMMLVLIPVLFAISNSFESRNSIAQIYGTVLEGQDGFKQYAGIKLLPDEINLEQYINLLLFQPLYLQKYLNSIMLTVPIVSGQLIISCFAAYGFAKLRFPLRDKLFFIYIIVMLMPFQVTLVPNYIMMSHLGLMNSFAAIILPGIFGTFGVFLLRQFMRTIPDEYTEAARIDGAGPLKTFRSIILPQCKGALAALTILTFIDNWNMVDQPIVMLSDEKKYPFSLLLAYISDKDITVAFAGGVIYMIPVVCFALYFHEYLLKGIELSGMK